MQISPGREIVSFSTRVTYKTCLIELFRNLKQQEKSKSLIQVSDGKRIAFLKCKQEIRKTEHLTIFFFLL